MKSIEQLLSAKIGLDAASVGSAAIERAVRLRMKNLRLKEIAAYRRLLSSSPAEWDEFIQSVIVTETWFFRDREPFDLLVRFVNERWLPGHAAGQLRLLSLPCASGEE